MTPPPAPNATARTVAMTGLLGAVALLALQVVPEVAPIAAGLPHLPWWGIALGFGLAEVAVVHLEFREEAQSVTLSGVVMVLGLYLGTPLGLVLGRMLGPVPVLLRMRMRPVKLGFNLAVYLAEAAVALMVFHLVLGAGDLQRPGSWVAALLAVAAAEVLSATAVTVVIRWHTGAAGDPKLAVALLACGIASGCLGLVAVLLVAAQPLALGLLLVVVGVVHLAYKGYAQLTQRYANLNLLYDFTDALSAADDAAGVTRTILTHARTIMRARVAELLVLPEGGGRPIRHVLDEDGMVTLTPASEGQVSLLQGSVLRGRSLLASRDTLDPLGRAYVGALGHKDGIVVPISTDGLVIGVLGVGNRMANVSTFDTDDLRLFEALANHAGIALDNGRLIEQLRAEVAQREHQALHDGLTGLPNRTRFTEECTAVLAAAGAGRLTGVVVMDVDAFKEVNDTLGHDAGDELLVELGARLQRLAPPASLVARLGGDEFAVLVPDQPDLTTLRQLARRLRDGLSVPVMVDDLALTVEVSTGVACSPIHGQDPAALLQRADIAMYAAKSARSGLAIYAPEEDRASRRRLRIAGALRRAIAEETLDVHFQPKVSVVDGRVVGAEALVRWHDPELGVLRPDEFIPLAERTELMMPLTELVLREAAEQCRRWHDAGHPISVAVNVAARSVPDDALRRMAVARLQAVGLELDQLTLEITESGIMGDTTRAATALHRIAATGIRLSVDDFGTGHSSLAYLQQLPVHEVKVDRSFLRHGLVAQSDRAVVEGIIRLGHALGLSVVAEGVEDPATVGRLSGLGCDIGQGYHWARPMDAASFLGWLDAQDAPATDADTAAVT